MFHARNVVKGAALKRVCDYSKNSRIKKKSENFIRIGEFQSDNCAILQELVNISYR